MIVLFTDFGLEGPYVGQMKAVLAARMVRCPVIDLCHDAPACRPDLAAYLLAAYHRVFPPGSIFVAVVDPGVGGTRDALLLKTREQCFIGPDNGLLAVTANHATQDGDPVVWKKITWQPNRLSSSFHGRDLFAPVAAKIANGDFPETQKATKPVGQDLPGDAAIILYQDHFGNLITGLRARHVTAGSRIQIGDDCLTQATTFSDVPVGESFWYENSNGLIELATHNGCAAGVLKSGIGDCVRILEPENN